MKNINLRIVSLVFVLVLCFMSLAGCGSGKQSSGSDSANPLITYSIYHNNGGDQSTFGDNPNDVVTPYIEEKFNIKVGDMISGDNTSLKEKMNLWIASKTLPDLFLSTAFELDEIHAMDILQPLDEYIDKMPNLNRYFEQGFWPRYMRDGKKFYLPCTRINVDPEDQYLEGDQVYAMWVREDILKMAGYDFEPLESIANRTTEVGKKPTREDFAITPPIKTPDDFHEMLQKIKSLDLTVNGKLVFPLDIRPSYQFHLGCIKGFGWFQRQDDGTVGGYMGLNGAKDWYRYLRQLYQEGLLDPDFMVQKDEQLQEKCAEGRVAVGFNIMDFEAARNAMAQINPDAKVRFMDWPKEKLSEGFFDIRVPAGTMVGINKDFKDAERLTQMFDWMLSEEGLDILSWGPESAGLWEVVDGVKKFKDARVENDVRNHISNSRGADYYGLYDITKYLSPFWSKAGNCFPYVMGAVPHTFVYSYPPNLDIHTVNMFLVGVDGMNTTGTATYGEGVNCDATTNYFWGEFYSITSAKLFEAKTDADFETAWDEIYADFLDKGNYEAAIADATEWLNKYGVK